MRLGRAFLIGIAAGALVMAFVNGPFNHGGTWPSDVRLYFGGMGVFFGSFAGLFALGLALAMPRRPKSEGSQEEPHGSRRLGLLLCAFVAGLLSFFVLSFNISWGVSIWSLEGAWLWPLGLVPLIVSIALFRTLFRSRPGA